MKKEGDSYLNNLNKSFWDEQVNRNRLFFCAHMNRKAAFFNKHILNSKKEPNDEARVAKIFEQMFGFNRMRSELKKNVLHIIRTLVNK